jgi:hypothetical protein
MVTIAKKNKLYHETRKLLEDLKNHIDDHLYQLFENEIYETYIRGKKFDISSYLISWKSALYFMKLKTTIDPNLKDIIYSYLDAFTVFRYTDINTVLNLKSYKREKTSTEFLILFRPMYLNTNTISGRGSDKPIFEVNITEIISIPSLSHVIKYMQKNNFQTAYFLGID